MATKWTLYYCSWLEELPPKEVLHFYTKTKCKKPKAKDIINIEINTKYEEKFKNVSIPEWIEWRCNWDTEYVTNESRMQITDNHIHVSALDGCILIPDYVDNVDQYLHRVVKISMKTELQTVSRPHNETHTTYYDPNMFLYGFLHVSKHLKLETSDRYTYYPNTFQCYYTSVHDFAVPAIYYDCSFEVLLFSEINLSYYLLALFLSKDLADNLLNNSTFSLSMNVFIPFILYTWDEAKYNSIRHSTFKEIEDTVLKLVDQYTYTETFIKRLSELKVNEVCSPEFLTIPEKLSEHISIVVNNAKIALERIHEYKTKGKSVNYKTIANEIIIDSSVQLEFIRKINLLYEQRYKTKLTKDELLRLKKVYGLPDNTSLVDITMVIFNNLL